MPTHAAAKSEMSLRRIVIRHSLYVAIAASCSTNVLLLASAADGPKRNASRSDEHALDHIFADQHLDDSGILVAEIARPLDEVAQYELFRDFVLGTKPHRRFRITADFASANHRRVETDLGSTDSPVGSEVGVAGNDSQSDLVQPKLISPAIELVKLAKSLGRLDTLREAARKIIATTPIEECDRLAFSSLIEMADGNLDVARTKLGSFFDIAFPDAALRDATREAALVCLTMSSAFPELHGITFETVSTLKEAYKKDTVRTDWHRHLYAVDVTPGAKSVDETNQWAVVTRSTAFDHGRASPQSRWQFGTASVRKLTSHSDDYLYFASPLKGDYAVEASATGFGYREAHLFVGGLWTGLVYNHHQYMVGNIRRELGRHELAFPFTDTHTHGMIRSRVAVKHDRAEVSLNGHPVVEHNLSPHQSPWVAVRSMFRVFGGVDDLTITGEPIIPDTIEMVGSHKLLGWYDYYQAPGTNENPLGSWSGSNADAANGEQLSEIVSRRDESIPRGAALERLLVYARPMLEDGVITYDFYHEPQQFTAHPAIGRTAFLITPNGVLLHRITDGKYERTTLRPDNSSPMQLTNEVDIPLNTNGWNRVRVELIGDVVRLHLNDTLILEHAVETPPNERTFGLFHYADASALRVQNPRWTGDWPKQLPALEDQHLASRLRTLIAANAEKRSAHIPIAVNQQAVAEGKVMPLEGDFGEHFEFTEDSILLTREGTQGYKNVSLAPQVSVDGDFDFTMSFEDYRGDPTKPNIANLRITAISEGDDHDRALLQLVTARDGDHNVQCMKMVKIDGEERRHYFGHRPDETTAGRLRLSRRGNRIYYQIAENDSSIFQLIGDEDFTTGPIGHGGFRATVQIQNGDGRVQAKVTGFDIRAETIDGIATKDSDALLARLNNERDELPIRVSHDFTQSPGDSDQFYRWGENSSWKADESGLVMSAPSSSNWISVGTSILESFTGDFDIRFDFASPVLLNPEPGRQSQIYLQVELADPERTQLSAMLSKHHAENTTAQAQSRTRPGNSWQYDTFATIPVTTLDQLRIARRGEVAYVIASNKEEGREFVVCDRVIGAAPTQPSGIRIMLHPGHLEGASTLVAKSIEVRSESQTKVVTPPVMRTPSVFESIFNIFD